MMSDASDTSAAGSPPPSQSPNQDTTENAKTKSGNGDNEKPTTKKRSDSTATDANGAKNTKRRAARACVSCRARKVRCDVVEQSPCGNCRWDNVEVRTLLLFAAFCSYFHNNWSFVLLF
jgi:hypothetical protein